MAYRPPGSKKGLSPRLLLLPLYFLSLLYCVAIKIRMRLYSASFLRTRELGCKVISVGNITVGGTGKTPVTRFIASNLQGRGFNVAILSRGYKGKKESDVNLVSDGTKIFLGPDRAGDEPYMLAKRLPGIPVIVGANRYKIGTYAQTNFQLDAVILDDGFQHIQLKRDLDVLIIDGEKGFGNEYLLPRGPLREPPSNIDRAGLILINKASQKSEELKERLLKINPNSQVFMSHYGAEQLTPLWGGKDADIGMLAGAKVLSLSAIANPSSFTKLLIALGARIMEDIAYNDHYNYSESDLDDAMKKAVDAKADFIVTTEKDAVKLEGFRPHGKVPVYFLKIALDMSAGEEKFIDSVIKLAGLHDN